MCPKARITLAKPGCPLGRAHRRVDTSVSPRVSTPIRKLTLSGCECALDESSSELTHGVSAKGGTR